MSEQTPGSRPAPLPPRRPSGRPTPDDQGSLWGGIGLAWAVMIGGGVALGSLGIAFWLWLVPPVAIVVWAVVLLAQGRRTRTGKGLLLGLASIVAVVLLLVAACFGLLMSGGGLHLG